MYASQINDPYSSTTLATFNLTKTFDNGTNFCPLAYIQGIGKILSFVPEQFFKKSEQPPI